MRELTLEEIEILSNRAGFMKITVENFLMRLNNNSSYGKDNERKRVEKRIQEIKEIQEKLNSADLANILVEIFKSYSKEDIIKFTQDYSILSKILIEKHGKEFFNKMTRSNSHDWEMAWVLFESALGIKGQ
jgi:hypothetical protein